jgi:hypothetical protein
MLSIEIQKYFITWESYSSERSDRKLNRSVGPFTKIKASAGGSLSE